MNTSFGPHEKGILGVIDLFHPGLLVYTDIKGINCLQRNLGLDLNSLLCPPKKAGTKLIWDILEKRNETINLKQDSYGVGYFLWVEFSMFYVCVCVCSWGWQVH